MIEKILNKVLKLDPQLNTQLAPLAGKLIRIDTLDFDKTIYIEITENGLTFPKEPLANADLTIKATPAAFILFLSKDNKQQEITLRGDTQLAQQLQTIFANAEFDFEEPLAKWIGDIGAHRIGRAARATKQFITEATQSIQKNMGEYIQEEIHYAPTQYEVETFRNDIIKLRDDVERLSARIQRLQKERIPS